MSSTLCYWFAVMLWVAPIYLIISGVRLYRAVRDKDEEMVQRF